MRFSPFAGLLAGCLWAVVLQTPAPPDGDRDGMPDAWERERGLNPAEAADGAGDRDGDGYTNVEEYINGLR